MREATMSSEQVNEDDPLLTEADAAKQLDVTVGTLQVWRSTKRYPLPYVKIGRNVRYRKSAVLAFIAARTVPA
jgi:excisionase family DNA binding protein